MRNTDRPARTSTARRTRLAGLVTCGLVFGLCFAANATKPATSASAEASPRPEYKIGVADVLSVFVYEEGKTDEALVRPDGRITLPLIGELEAAGKTPSELAQAIKDKWQPYQKDATVTVAVKEIHSYQVYVLGRVGEQNMIESVTPLRLLQAIARAKGLNDFASKSIVVLREGRNGQERISIDYDDLIKGKTPEMNILLEAGDMVVAK